MLSRFFALLVLGASLAGSPALAGCALADIEIKNWEWRLENSYLVVVGEFVNNCAQPISVQFQVVVRDAAGKVVDAEDHYSAGDDVPSGGVSAFKWMAPWVAKGKTVELKVIHLLNG